VPVFHDSDPSFSNVRLCMCHCLCSFVFTVLRSAVEGRPVCMIPFSEQS
jgi:hypothetical protein